MLMRLIALGAIAMFTLAGMVTPLGARNRAQQTSSNKTTVGPTETLQRQGGTPQIGHCLKCLPPPYAWPRGGPG
jgi:hypothetical protein